jgi:hypothetical protein
VVAPPKSNLKKPNCAADGVCAPKGNVKWLDLLGKDLTEVREFEPRYNHPHLPPLYTSMMNLLRPWMMNFRISLDCFGVVVADSWVNYCPVDVYDVPSQLTRRMFCMPAV